MRKAVWIVIAVSAAAVICSLVLLSFIANNLFSGGVR
jgi:hypothetical protein